MSSLGLYLTSNQVIDTNLIKLWCKLNITLTKIINTLTDIQTVLLMKISKTIDCTKPIMISNYRIK